MRIAILFLGSIIISCNAAAQSSGGFTVRGLFSEGAPSGALTVELVEHGQTQRADVSGDGSFEFHNLAAGFYELRVTSGAAMIHREDVLISGPNQTLAINLNSRIPVHDNRAGSVSIQQLQHQVPSEARKEFAKGLKATEKADHPLAIEHFNRAIAIDPEFADAYNNLGATRNALGHLEEAASAFEKAAELVPDHALALANLSIVLYKLRRYEDCVASSRRALKLNPSLLNIRYLLALSLSMNNGNETEALANLERAALEIPQARLLAANILVQVGRPEEAAQQLERYLKASAAEDAKRPTVEKWLSALRKE